MYRPNYSPQMQASKSAFDKAMAEETQRQFEEAEAARQLRAAEAIILSEDARDQELANQLPATRFRSDADYTEMPHDPQIARKRKSKARTTAMFTHRLEILMDAGFKDPIHALMEIVSGYQLVEDPESGDLVKCSFPKGQQPDAKTKVMAAETLLSYTFPKRKSVEVSAGEGVPIQFSVVADNSPLEEMPSDAELQRLQDEERDRKRTIEQQRAG